MKNRLLVGPAAVDNLKEIKYAYTKAVTERFSYRVHDERVSFHPALGLRNPPEREAICRVHPWAAATYREKNIGSYLKNARALMEIDSFRVEIGFNRPTYQIVEKEDYLSNRDQFFTAIDLIRKASPWIGQLFDLIVYDVYFTKRNEEVRYIGGGGSTYRLLGLIFMSFRPQKRFPEIEMAISLVHELGHNCFFLIQAGARPIVASSIEKEVYSGVRKTERSSYGALQALVALAYMLSFCWDYYFLAKESGILEIEQFLLVKIKALHSDFEQGLSAFQKVDLTEVGKIVIFEFLELNRQSGSRLNFQ